MADPFCEWRIDGADFPHSGSSAEQLRFLLGYAILAPSGHNTQPWLFRLIADEVELIADRTRCLPVVDPLDRALLISCGAALGHLRSAARGFGRELDVVLFPSPTEPDLLARARLGGKFKPTAQDNARLNAIARRRTTRVAYADEPLPQGLAERLGDDAAQWHCELAIVTALSAKQELACLIGEGDRAQMGNPAFRRELASWVHSRRSASRDGMSGAAFGMPDLLSAVGGLVIRTFDMGDKQAATDTAIATGSPALLVLGTAGDEPGDWLNAGLALSAILLEVTAAGWTSAYLNQPIETDHLRPEVARAAGLSGIPQLLFRIGRAEPIDPSIRRPVEAVLIDVSSPVTQ